jgi:hypothetical protein
MRLVHVESLFGYGVWIPPAPRHLDLTPLVAILTALVIARFVVGVRLSPPTAVGAAFVGALWAYLAQPLGLVIPSMAALLLVIVLRWVRVGGGGHV